MTSYCLRNCSSPRACPARFRCKSEMKKARTRVRNFNLTVRSVSAAVIWAGEEAGFASQAYDGGVRRPRKGSFLRRRGMGSARRGGAGGARLSSTPRNRRDGEVAARLVLARSQSSRGGEVSRMAPRQLPVQFHWRARGPGAQPVERSSSMRHPRPRACGVRAAGAPAGCPSADTGIVGADATSGGRIVAHGLLRPGAPTPVAEPMPGSP